MEGLIPRILVNWQPKAISVLTALIIWLLVNNTITSTRVVGNVAVRITNIPANKTVVGMGENGVLRQKLTLTITGSKDVIDRIEPSDLEVVIDASGKDKEWIGTVTRSNLVSHNPDVDISQHIDHIRHNQFIVRMTDMITKRIAIRVNIPRGEPPTGYQFLDVWPQKLYHTVSGPREKVEELKRSGLELNLDLSSVSLSDLDGLAEAQGLGTDEVRFLVPPEWKTVAVPFLSEEQMAINDPDAANLHIEFLRRELLPVKREIPIRVYYPLRSANRVNPSTFSIIQSDLITARSGITTLALPLYAQEVSRLFLDVCRDQLEIVMIASANIDEPLRWAVQLVDPWRLEDEYVRRMLPAGEESTPLRDKFLRERFRGYMQKFALYKSNGQQLLLDSVREQTGISIQDITPEPS